MNHFSGFSSFGSNSGTQQKGHEAWRLVELEVEMGWVGLVGLDVPSFRTWNMVGLGLIDE